MPTPDSSIITQLLRSLALANNQIGLQQNGRKPNNTFGAQQYNSSRPSTKKMQPLPFDQQIQLLFNQLNNPSQITQTFFTNLNESLKNQNEPSLIPITSTALRTYYNNNNLPSTINFLATTNGSEGQTFPLSKLTSGEYFAFSNTYPTIITSSSTTYKLTIIQSGADLGKLRIESKDLINTSYTDITDSPFDKGEMFTLGSNTYYYAGAGSPGIIFSTVPFPNITVNVSDFLGINNIVDPTNVSGDSTSGTISNTLGSEKLCFPTNLTLGVTPNTFILHDRKRIAKISITIDDITQKEVPIITTLYTFPDASTKDYGNFTCSCIQKDDNTFFWTKGASNLIYYTDDNFATEQTIGDPNYVYGNILGGVLPTDNPPQFERLTKLIFNKTKTKIYVPDLFVSLLRIVDISNMTNITVQTLKDLNGNNVNFNKVLDVKEYDDNNLLLSIQTPKRGNQLIIVDINSGIINRIYGNGEQTWVDSDKDNSSITGNTGIEIDYANERVYFTHNGSGVRMLDLNTGNFYTIAGSILGYVNNGQLSKFNKLMGMLYDNTTQTLYLCDGANYRIRKVKLALQNPNPIVDCNYASGFNGPVGITRDSLGNLYVTNLHNNTVSKVDTSGNVITYAIGFNGPVGITIDSSGNLYVSNNHNNTISKVDTSRNVTTYASGLNGALGITIDSSGNLYVCNGGNDTVSKVDTFRNVTTYASGFSYPGGVAIDSSGNLYVCNGGNDTVSKIDTSGNVTTYASGFNSPAGITIDSSGNLYVCNYNSGVVSKVDTSRNVTTYAPVGGPFAITIDSSNNLYVTNVLDNIVCKISPPKSGGSTVVTITPPNPNPNPNPIVDCNYASGFYSPPHAITIDSSGNLYVCNPGGDTVSKVDTSRNVTTYASGFNNPNGITIDSSGNLYVTSFDNNIVSKVDTSRNVTTYASGFSTPYAITIDSSGNLYVGNTSNNTVSKVDTSRNVTMYASGFNSPAGITIDSSGNLYVANFGNNTVSKVDTSRNVTTYASGFNNPAGITIDSSGNLYVGNYTNNTISKVDTSRNVTTYASVGRPSAITIDSSRNLYITNAFDNKVCKISPPDIGTYHIQLRVIGVTPGNITQDMKNNFKNDFAALIGVDPAMLTIELRSGSLVVNISFNASYGASGFSDNDCALIKNTIAILNQVSISDIEKIKNDRNIDFTWSINAYIDYESIKINIDVGLINTINSRFNNYNIINPLVGDIENNCMYTIIGSIVVRINKNGTISRIALFPESQGCRYIFIDSTSSFLVIPSNVQDTTSVGATDNSPRSNKVYIIRLSDGIVFTKTLNQLYLTRTNCGFNQFNNRFYYTSYMASPNYLKLCYIPITLSNETLTATYTILSGGNESKIEFIDNNNGFIGGNASISLLNFSNNTSTIIAGQGSVFGGWSNLTPPNNSWGTSVGRVYGPYLDAPIGTNAFFSYIQDITYDSENNRLLVADLYAQRIRSVDLRAGNNYAVTTLAGTSPVLYGQAINGSGTNYSPSVLASLGQVGIWNNGTNQMPSYTKVNSSYSNSTFNNPRSLITFKGKIYFLDDREARQLVNNRVSDFIPFANDITKITLGSLGGGPSITFTISNSNFTLSDTEKQSFINEFMKSYPSINKNNLVFTFTSGSIVVNIKYKDNIDVTTLTNDELSTIQNLEIGFSDKVEVLANFRTAITTTTFISGSITLDVGGQTSTITGEIIITIPTNLINYIDGKIPNKISPFFLQIGNDGTIYTTNGLNDVLSVDRRFGFTTKICTLPPPTIPNTTRTVSGVIGIDSLSKYLIVRDSLSDNTNTYVSPSYFYIVDISTKTSYQINLSDFATGISGYNSSGNINNIVFNKFNNKIYIDIRFLQNNAYPPIGYFSGTFNYSSKTFSLDSNTPLTNFDYNLASNYNSIANPTATNSSGSSSTSFIFINANEYICTINNQICRFNINTNLLTRIIGDLNISLRKFNPNRNIEEVLWGKFNYQGPILFSSIEPLVNYNSISDTLFVCDRTAKVMLSISPILGAGTPTITKIYGTPNIDLDAQGYPNSSLITNPLEPRRFFINNVTGTNKGTLTPNTLNFIFPLLPVQNVLDNRIYVTGLSSKLIRNPSSITQDSEIYETTVIVGNKAILYKINNTS